MRGIVSVSACMSWFYFVCFLILSEINLIAGEDYQVWIRTLSDWEHDGA